MRINGLTTTAALALCLAGTSHAFAQSATGPISNIGVIGSHNQYKLTIDDESDKARLNQGGLYYNFGNKLTGQEGSSTRPASRGSTATRMMSSSCPLAPISTWACAQR